MASNDQLSCRAALGDLPLSYSVNIPIKLTATRSTAALCCADNIHPSIAGQIAWYSFLNAWPHVRRGPFFYISFELRAERCISHYEVVCQIPIRKCLPSSFDPFARR